MHTLQPPYFQSHLLNSARRIFPLRQIGQSGKERNKDCIGYWHNYHLSGSQRGHVEKVSAGISEPLFVWAMGISSSYLIEPIEIEIEIRADSAICDITI